MYAAYCDMILFKRLYVNTKTIQIECKMTTATGPSGAGSLPHHFADARC